MVRLDGTTILGSVITGSQRAMCRLLSLWTRHDQGDRGPLSLEDLWRVFEYLAAEHMAAGRVSEGHLEALAGELWLLSGAARTEAQCRLAAAINGAKPGEFYLAIQLAARFPVPHARGTLLEMLTQKHIARWRSSRPLKRPDRESDPRCEQHEPIDLRPIVIAALGQLQDPSLLGLFHRLFGKLSASSQVNSEALAAVNRTLSRLAPGREATSGHAERASARGVSPTEGATSRQVERIGSVPSERNDLLADFGS